MAEGKEECAAQFSGLQGKHSKCSNHSIWCKPGSGLDTGVVRGVGSAHTAGQKHLGCLLFWLEFPGDHKLSQEPGCPEHGVWGCVTSRSSD